MRPSLSTVLLGFALLSLAIYFGNPSGTASKDPRARLFGFLMFQVPSISNAPTLNPGDFVLVSTYAYWRAPPARGDLLVFFPPHDSRAYIKRAIAIGGDRIAIQEGVVMVNGVAIAEPYLAAGNSKRASTMQEVEVPGGHLFVLGDNRDRSEDSRFWGYVTTLGVIGRVTYVF